MIDQFSDGARAPFLRGPFGDAERKRHISNGNVLQHTLNEEKIVLGKRQQTCLQKGHFLLVCGLLIGTDAAIVELRREWSQVIVFAENVGDNAMQDAAQPGA